MTVLISYSGFILEDAMADSAMAGLNILKAEVRKLQRDIQPKLTPEVEQVLRG